MESNKKISIKWNKEVIPVEVPSKTAGQLKKEICEKTNVEPGRQKLLFKGKILSDDYELSKVPEGSTITMMGTASANVMHDAKTKKSAVFIEDLSPEEKAKILREKGEEVVYGLENLGNTCYLNSTLQCLGRVPELRRALETATSSAGGYDISKELTKTIGEVYQKLDNAHDTVVPSTVINSLRTMNPMFAEQDRGYYKQQDAEECYSLILNTIKQHLPNKENGEKFSSNLIEELFGVEVDINMVNVEEPTELKSKKENLLKLTCYIDNQTSELVEGLKKSLKENIESHSDKLGRNTIFQKSQMISRLPPYLTIQFMRFFWKQANVMTGASAGKTKILKSVLFSKVIDMYELCTDATKEILNLGRKIEGKMLKEDPKFRIDQVEPKEGQEMIPTGRYQLIAVLTHQGRSSESGHYIGWTHKKGDKWKKFDDDVIYTVDVSEILELKGGGDWHMAYICIFKRLEVPFMEVEES